MPASSAFVAAKMRHPWLPSNIGGVATRLGMTIDDYVKHLDAGEKWCTADKQWHPRSAFGSDKGTADGLLGSCRVARNGHPDHDTPTGRPRGRRQVDGRDGDRKQARSHAHQLVRMGLLPTPNTMPCVDCGHRWADGDKRHQMDHHLGYDAEHHGHVEVVCSGCHYRREYERGAHDNARRRAVAATGTEGEA